MEDVEHNSKLREMRMGISLIIKVLKKGVCDHVLWSNKDAEGDPLTSVTNFIKTVAVAIFFPTKILDIIVLKYKKKFENF